MSRLFYPRLFAIGVCATAIAVSGCASVPAQVQPDDVSQWLQLLPDSSWPRLSEAGHIDHNHTASMSVDEATRLMLLHSPRVRTLLASVGVADAIRAQASLISNPRFAVGALRPEGGGRLQLDFGLTQSLMDVFTRGLRQDLAEQQWLVAQLELQQGLQHLVAELQHSWFSAITAEQLKESQAIRYQASQARVTLAKSLYDAGNISETLLLLHELDLHRQQQDFDKAVLTASEKYLALRYLMGVSEENPVRLPSLLPEIPQEIFEPARLLEEGKQHQPLLQLSRAQQQQLEYQAQLTGQSIWRDINAGIDSEREFDGRWNTGAHIDLGLPLFDRGKHRQAALSARLAANQARQDDLLPGLRRQIAAALAQMEYARKAAADAREATRVASRRLDLLQREVNFMITSPFELLSAKQQVVQFEEAVVLAREVYWKARTGLEQAIGKQLPLPDSLPSSVSDPAPPAAPQHDHSHHLHTVQPHSRNTPALEHNGGHHHD